MSAPIQPAELKPYDSILPYKRISFPTYDGTTLRGNLYHAPSPAANPAPIVIFIHGLGLLKEQYLENWFKYCLTAGYHVLTYDHRSSGDSDGLPRNKFSWMGQAQDFVDAVTYVRGLEEVDESKVFGWGVAHAGGVLGMAAAIDKRIAGIIMFLPCIDGAWDKSRWSESFVETSTGQTGTLWDVVQRNRFHTLSRSSTISSSREATNTMTTTASAEEETITFWPLSTQHADPSGPAVLSGSPYIQQWSLTARHMAEQGSNSSTFTGTLTLSSIWDDFSTSPLALFSRIAPTPLLWIMASEDIVAGDLEWTMAEFEKLGGEKEVLVLRGEHLPQYFGEGFRKSVEGILGWLGRFAGKGS